MGKFGGSGSMGMIGTDGVEMGAVCGEWTHGSMSERRK